MYYIRVPFPIEMVRMVSDHDYFTPSCPSFLPLCHECDPFSQLIRRTQACGCVADGEHAAVLRTLRRTRGRCGPFERQALRHVGSLSLLGILQTFSKLMSTLYSGVDRMASLSSVVQNHIIVTSFDALKSAKARVSYCLMAVPTALIRRTQKECTKLGVQTFVWKSTLMSYVIKFVTRF